MGRKGSSTLNNKKDKHTRKESSTSALMNKREGATSQKRLRKNKDMVTSNSSETLRDVEKYFKKSAFNVKKSRADVDIRHLVSSRMSVSAFSETNYKVNCCLSSDVFPTLSPEETLLKLFYSDVSQLDAVKYLNYSSWLKSVSDYRRFCFHQSEAKMGNLASVYKKLSITGHNTSEKEISVTLGERNGMEKQKKSMLNENDKLLRINVLGGHLPCSAGICSNDSLHPSVMGQFPEALSTWDHLPADFISDAGKHFHSEYVDNNANRLFSVEIVNDLNLKPKFSQFSSDGDSTVKVKSVAVNDVGCPYTEDITSFQKCLYSLLRFQPVPKSHVNTDRLWWGEISLLDVYNIFIAGIFLCFLIK